MLAPQSRPQLLWVLEETKEKNSHVLLDSDLDDLSNALNLVKEASKLCSGEWRENPSRLWIERSGGNFLAKKC